MYRAPQKTAPPPVKAVFHTGEVASETLHSSPCVGLAGRFATVTVRRRTLPFWTVRASNSVCTVVPLAATTVRCTTHVAGVAVPVLGPAYCVNLAPAVLLSVPPRGPWVRRAWATGLDALAAPSCRVAAAALRNCRSNHASSVQTMCCPKHRKTFFPFDFLLTYVQRLSRDDKQSTMPP